MTTLFTRIVNGEIPCHRLAEDENYLAFLDIRPIRAGHALVIPKQPTDYLFDLDDDLLGGLLCFARPVAKAIQQVVPCRRIGVTVIGLEVPHCHVHLIPIDGIHDMDFRRAQPADPDQLSQLADRIRKITDY